MSTLYVTGIGPGSDAFLTTEARTAIERADVICGYTLYVELLRSRYPEKEFITTPMRQEIERCRLAMEAASSDRAVAMVCSGDAGIYGMAGPLLEMSDRYPEVDIQIVPRHRVHSVTADDMRLPDLFQFAQQTEFIQYPVRRCFSVGLIHFIYSLPQK